MMADCLQDSGSYQTIIESAHCFSDEVIIGKVIMDIPNSKNYAYLPTRLTTKSNHEYIVKVNRIIKGEIKDTISVFCGSSLNVCYTFDSSKWPYHKLNNGFAYVLFLGRDSIASQIHQKNIYRFWYAFNNNESTTIINLCKRIEIGNCDRFKADTAEAAIRRAILDSLILSKRKKKN
jgi:hypothetical protein